MNELALLPAPPLRRRLFWWGGLIALFLCFAATLVVSAVYLLSAPAFASIDELDADRVTGMTFFVLNRPDGSPDLGNPRAHVTVPAADRPAVLDLLRGATKVDSLPPKIWLGRLTVELADGRKQSILMYWTDTDRAARKPLRVRFKIGPHQFEGGSVDELVAKLATIEANPERK